MEQMSREELIALYQRLEGQYLTLNERIEDIRKKQGDITKTQLDVRDAVYTIDYNAGLTTCPTCWKRASRETKVCSDCGEEL